MHEEYLINYLKRYSYYRNDRINTKALIRGLMNTTIPNNLSDEFYKKQDEYLQDLVNNIETIDVTNLDYQDNIALFQGDIIKLKADALVNAGNSALLGCFSPNHTCIDNAIHSYAGLEVRRDLMNILNGRNVANGEVIPTLGYNLKAKYIFHTVGPIYNNTKENEIDLSLCYINSLKEASKLHLNNIVFCSISTGVYGYPIEEASKIAIDTVKKYMKDNNLNIKVIFDTFSDYDFYIYRKALNHDN